MTRYFQAELEGITAIDEAVRLLVSVIKLNGFAILSNIDLTNLVEQPRSSKAVKTCSVEAVQQELTTGRIEKGSETLANMTSVFILYETVKGVKVIVRDPVQPGNTSETKQNLSNQIEIALATAMTVCAMQRKRRRAFERDERSKTPISVVTANGVSNRWKGTEHEFHQQ
ncbi:MAG: hypothetical protein P8Y36_02275 [Alphaproteobacteria bacterium]